MRTETEYISSINRWTISSSYVFQAHPAALPKKMFFLGCSTVIQHAPRLVVGTLSHVVGALRLVAGAPRCSQVYSRRSDPGRWRFQVFPGAMKAIASVRETLGLSHPDILVQWLSVTPSGFQWLISSLLMQQWIILLHDPITIIECQATTCYRKILNWGQHNSNGGITYLVIVFGTVWGTADQPNENPGALSRHQADSYSNITNCEQQWRGILTVG